MDEKNAVAILKRKRESDKAGMVRYRERRISQGDKQVTTWWSAENVLWLREWQKQHGGTAETIINMAIQIVAKTPDTLLNLQRKGGGVGVNMQRKGGGVGVNIDSS